MIKNCIFLEGQTERIFFERLLSEYLGEHNFSREVHKRIGKYQYELLYNRHYPNAKIHFLIFECVGDEKVISDMIERSNKLINENGFSYILALRDLYPNKRNEKHDVIKAINKIFSKFTYVTRMKLVLAIMEIESWFLADYNLFQRIDKNITPNYIKTQLGYDLINDDIESYPKPSEIVNEIYHLFGKIYKKRESQAYEIAHRIDYNKLCCSDELLQKISSFNYFINCINSCIDPGMITYN